jgi:plastocyanin
MPAPRSGAIGLAVRITAALVAVSALVFAIRGALPAPTRAATSVHHMGMAMSEESMQQRAASWWASHPRTGVNSAQLTAAVFTVQNYRFDTDHNPSTQVDTAQILIGESVQWRWVNGAHTVTYGVDSSDPNAGLLFNQSIDVTHPTFNYLFDEPGTYPFFCYIHESFNMTGVVVVSAPTPAGHKSWGAVKQRYRP